ncbi:F-box domain containing protein [Melia azedarach]|uniref:F-box domain containing protein n=1 Tax=Melia azedarach TaxID=155640 RepID=A0ACC1WTE1_MELAZ|nr:F-box domain containing protein [Melia azedarach]
MHHQYDQFHTSFSFLVEYWSHSNSTELMIKIGSSNVVQSLNFLYFLPHSPQHEIRVATCFKDLVVCCQNGAVYADVYYICNPLTRQFQMLPPAPKRCVENMLGFICYPHPCDKKQACTTYARYSYKLVRINKFEGYKREFNVDIFSSETGKWSEKLVRSPKRLSSLYRSHIVAYNGILYWMDEGNIIVAYDPLNDVGRCRVIDSPIYDGGRNFATEELIGVCGGRLRILQRISYFPGYECVSTKLSMWELEDCNTGKWKREEQVNIKDLDSEDYGMMKQVSRYGPLPGLLGFHPIEEDIVYLSFPGRVVKCNMRTRMLEEVCELQHHRADGAGAGGEEDILCLCGTVFPLVHRWWPTPVPILPAAEVDV